MNIRIEMPSQHGEAPSTEQHPYEVFFRTFAARRDLALHGRVVIPGRSLDFQTSRQGKSKYFLELGTQDAALKDWQVFEKEIITESGKHIHQGGLVIYVIEGSGYSEFDGVRLDWKAGDLLSLPIKPGGVEHQHFNTSKGRSRWVAFVFVPILHATGSLLIQVEDEDAPHALPTEVPPAAAVSSRKPTLFETTLAEAAAEHERQQHAQNLIRREDAQEELTPMGRLAWYLHPHLEKPSTRALYFHELDIPAGSRSGKLNCQGGIVHYVVEGEGYTELDGKRHFWEAGDVIALPIREYGIAYQHFSEHGARMVVTWPNHDSTIGPGGGVAMQVLEAAPEFQAAD